MPKKPAGEGGWGVAYAMAKGAAHRIAGVMHAEYSAQGLRAYSLNPGHVTTEVMSMRAQREGRAVTGNGPEDVATATRWLIEGNEEAVALSGLEVISRDVIQRLRNSGIASRKRSSFVSSGGAATKMPLANPPNHSIATLGNCSNVA